MIRVVGIQRSEDPDREFVLLQNQGSMRVHLRGHALVAEEALDGPSPAMHVFSDDEWIIPGAFVMLRTGVGRPGSGQTRDGALLYKTFMARPELVWSRVSGPVHVLAPQHSYVERRVTALA